MTLLHGLRAVTLLLSALVPALAGPLTLYDATLGTVPGAQGWLYNNPSGAVQSAGANFVELDTTSANAVKAGYGRLSPVTIDVNTGYHLIFDAQVITESHATNDRAGFSLIAIGSGLSGIELGFWTGQVFAQNQSFTHGEQGIFDTTAMTRYDLFLTASGYDLWANGTSLVSGALRNYSGSALPPYVVSNSLFLGDDTSSAQADLKLSLVEAEALPEPGTFLLLCGALLPAAFRTRNARP